MDELRNQLSRADGSTYIRWGRKTCPKDAVLVYEGSAGSGNSLHTGAAANTLCLSNKPEWNEYIDGFQGGTRIYGAEYWAQNTLSKFNAVHNHDVPCVVCRIRHGNVMMVPGQNNCRGGYTLQYSGYLMAGNFGQPGTSEYICMDREPEKGNSGSGEKPGTKFLSAQGECGTLECPPYVEGREITCAVCSYTSRAIVDPLS
ncbi:uncharacterized protein LOC132740830 [Ruditapes philippinarum]|uniref:uncharacterized protein LOC132740830 n=1 Tax=Ruditapes philippinarum TaxID=129788 RepID=UPI00295BB09F|nr:uncharacterized protein LOC132740830 [Ruditapes philippinarum]